MPDWLLPLLCGAAIALFLYFAFRNPAKPDSTGQEKPNEYIQGGPL